MKKGFAGLFILGMLLYISCKKPFQPNVTTTNANLLVVEGMINATDSSFIRLSRTVIIANKTGTKTEAGAAVTIESDAGTTYAMTEKTTGYFYAAPLALDASKKYRIRIRVAGARLYLSEFVPVKLSPSLDSLSWQATQNGLEVYANAHDPSNATRYYRWDFSETWMFHAKYRSEHIIKGKTVVVRNPVTENVYTCWTSANSNIVVLGSSARLEKDVIHNNLVTTIVPESEKVSIKYSILVRQYALTKEAFEFWQLLKTNTEKLGSVFDAQPSQLEGNIHCLADDKEPVVGYISAGSFQEKRIFITKAQLPDWKTVYPYDCELDSIYYINPTSHAAQLAHTFFETTIPYLYPVSDFGDFGGGYMASTGLCTDCTLRGTTKQPAFWQ